MNINKLINRDNVLFSQDVALHEKHLSSEISRSSFLIVGGAGSIGQAVVKEIFSRNPRCLHVVDISENNLVELVRDIRSSLGYLSGDFNTLPIDCGSLEFENFVHSQKKYDYILNFSSLKHVRSEKDPFTLIRMIDVNILNVEKILQNGISQKIKKYFTVSTDKATNPINMMGGTKKIMEMFLLRASSSINISFGRFPNVAFSDGSLPFGFIQRLKKRQPISAPKDVKRYFITEEEAGKLCLLSCILGENKEIFLPKIENKLNLESFTNIAIRFLKLNGFEPYYCETEEEARRKIDELIPLKKWPCYFFQSDTTGEKPFEELYSEDEIIDWKRFKDIGIIKCGELTDSNNLEYFLEKMNEIKRRKHWDKSEVVSLFKKLIPEFCHEEKNKYLDGRM